MADKHPLQAGDVAPDYSGYDASTEADRRPQTPNSVRAIGSNYHGQYPAADQARAEGGRMWKVGQAQPNMQAPWTVINMDGDNNGMPAEIHEIDILSYGDCYDPTAPTKVRVISSAENHYQLDSDEDGHLN